MSWFDLYEEEWKALIETVSRALSLEETMVEKDVVQSMLLCKISSSSLPLVFKGGTSLSKAYGLIKRFSEDIDLSASRKLTASEKRKTKEVILEAAESCGLDLINPDHVKSRHDYNLYDFEYESLFNTVKGEILLETSFYQTSYPVEMHEVAGYISCFCRERGIRIPIPFPSASFSMNVQSLSRTFVDKIFAICDYRIANKLERDSRHLCDIYKLLPNVKLDDQMKDLVDKVRKDRMFSKNNPSAQPEYDIPSMLKEIVESRYYESDYNNVTSKLLYEEVSYETAIDNGIKIVSQTGIFSYRQ